MCQIQTKALHRAVPVLAVAAAATFLSCARTQGGEPSSADAHQKSWGWCQVKSSRPPSFNNPWSSPGMSGPYRYTSLKGLSNDEIVQHMGEAKSVFDASREAVIKTHVPDGFWEMTPRDAAVAYADANRTPDHRKRFRLTVGQGRPPEVCSLIFHYLSAPDYNVINEHCFVRCDPDGSYFAYAVTWSPGGVGYDFTRARTAYDLRWCKLGFEEARHVVQAVWWLDHIRSNDMAGDGRAGSGWSSADGTGMVALIPDDGQNGIRRESKSWAADAVSDRWLRGYGKEAFLNLAEYLATSALPARLGERWTSFDSQRGWVGLGGIARLADEHTERELARLKELASRFLELFSLDQRHISVGLARVAADIAGEFALADLAPRLWKILAVAPDKKTRPRDDSLLRLDRTVADALAKLSIADDLVALPSQLRAQRDRPGCQHRQDPADSRA